MCFCRLYFLNHAGSPSRAPKGLSASAGTRYQCGLGISGIKENGLLIQCVGRRKGSGRQARDKGAQHSKHIFHNALLLQYSAAQQRVVVVAVQVEAAQSAGAVYGSEANKGDIRRRNRTEA